MDDRSQVFEIVIFMPVNFLQIVDISVQSEINICSFKQITEDFYKQLCSNLKRSTTKSEIHKSIQFHLLIRTVETANLYLTVIESVTVFLGPILPLLSHSYQTLFKKYLRVFLLDN